MKTKYKIAFEQILSGMAVMASFIVLYLLLNNMSHATTKSALHIIVLAAIFAIPAYILGNVIGFRKYYIRRDHRVILDRFERGVLVQLAVITFIAGNVFVIMYIGLFMVQKYPMALALFLLPVGALIWVLIKFIRRMQKYLREGNVPGSGIIVISMRRLFILNGGISILAMLLAGSFLWGLYLLITARSIGCGILLLGLSAFLCIGILRVAAWGVRTFGIPDTIDAHR